MKENRSTRIVGDKVLLVPYEKKNVPKYHTWMKSPELQKLTASEPLSLEEEYKMQESWSIDEDKCTFIILDKGVLQDTNDEIEAMIGDTNLFLLSEDSGEKVAEAEIMIAEASAQGKHCGWEAMLLMLRYGAETLGIQKFLAKIGSDNFRSISMFKKMGLVQVGHSAVFEEVSLEKNVDHEWLEWLQKETHSSITEAMNEMIHTFPKNHVRENRN